MEKICSQIDFYFSDFNLHHDRYMRSFITTENSLVPVDILLKFNLINQLLENESINNLIDVFKQYQFENVRFIAEKQSFQRINAFVYDKSGYMKSMMDSIVHVSRLPSTVSATMVDLIKWISNLFDNGENGLYGINVCKRSKENGNSIRSALIVLKNGDYIQVLQEKIQSFDNDIRIVPYRDYIRYKNKLRMKRRQKKSMINRKFGQMVIKNENNGLKTLKQQQRLHGLRSLVAKRTIIMNSIPDPIAKCMMIQDDDGCRLFKQYLQPIGLVYLYRPKLNQSTNNNNKNNNNNNNISRRDYYLFFKNRTLLLQFYNRLRQEDPMKVFGSLLANSNNNNNEWMMMNNETTTTTTTTMITGKNFSLINMADDDDNLPRRFIHYVHCVRKFFQNRKAQSSDC
ncbi:hypothetical protein HUG17_9582 [Dermatophagoides farinae]|uniref:HTH La-type RNA-binding domain-containing protein n=1 Tax=Dermatophagoides farinae TaxID=6954 RepID=A0A9D4SIP1_DERFA|nr:hypothetical protein HUG17_9582 [Dermatophagoides farinae]